jgi:hypothetical protein
MRASDAFEQMADQIPGWEGYVQSKWYGGLAYLYRTDVIEDSCVVPLPVDEVFLDGWWDYERDVSDHRPVALRITLAE